MTMGVSKKLTTSDFILAAASGFMIALTFPDYELWPLAWVGLIPLFIALREKQTHQGAILGMVTGLFYFGPTVPWLSNTMIDFGHLPPLLAHAATALTITILSFYIGLFGFLHTKMARVYNELYACIWAPLIWVAIEMLRMYFPIISFPWARIADSQYNILSIIQFADIFGEEGVSFLIVMVNAAFASLLYWYQFRNKERSKPSFPLTQIVVVAFAVISSLAYGAWRQNNISEPDGEAVKVALIQGNIDQNRKWDKNYKDEQLAIYVNATARAAGDGAQFVVWPETAAPFYYGSDAFHDSIIENLSQSNGIPIVFGAPGFKRDGENYTAYNRAWIVTPDGRKDKYDKVHLVPFGEYVPLKKALFFLERLVTALGDMEPGDQLNLLDSGRYKIGVQICYEIIFPAYSRIMAQDGAAVIVNITNDSWFGDSPASRQSMAMAVFRAVENRAPILRAAQSGVSTIILPSGEITGETNLFERTTLSGEFTPKQGGISYFTAGGWTFGWLIALVAIAQIVVVFRNKS